MGKLDDFFPLSFLLSVTVPGGCRSQGCHGYCLRSGRLPQGFQAPFPHSSIIGDEFNCNLYVMDPNSTSETQNTNIGQILLTVPVGTHQPLAALLFNHH